jgi:fatty-acyl-CoA synthase
MVISGGENVYPVAVENVLEQHRDVVEAAVIGEPDPEFGQVLTAHVVLRPGGRATPDSLRAWCRGRLAPFQVPRRIVVHGELPFGATGKVVKRLLAEPT